MVRPDGVVAGVTMSVGVVRMPLAGALDTALSAADAAMYRAKRAGGNRVVGMPPEPALRRRHGRRAVAQAEPITDSFPRVPPRLRVVT